VPSLSDFVVFSSARVPILIVECKVGKETSAANAASLRRNLVAHSLIPTAPYFMLAYPTAIFLWGENATIDALPAQTASAKPILKDYVPHLVDHTLSVVGEGLQIAVLSWLSDLAAGVRQPKRTSEPDMIVVTSGLYEKIRNGVVSSRLAL
jgi:hypothetical protein